MCIFLPTTVLLFYWLGAGGFTRVAITWLASASLFFYAWWNPIYLLLLIGSITFNYSIGTFLARAFNARNKTVWVKVVLVFGIIANLTLLGYFKYANFFLNIAHHLTETRTVSYDIILPLAISFFTFQQITYLVDASKGLVDRHGFMEYTVFVTFFPQLIAGPIVHHRDMLNQFQKKKFTRYDSENIAVGTTIFTIGLVKKVLIADNAALLSTPIFTAVANGQNITFIDAWVGTLAFTFQLYFDFSGYSDMAIGLARMFGVNLPINFNSPYKAVNIGEFWRRWHMTLSQFLRDYLYIPLGGNRHGDLRRHANLIITMLLGGLWHGAGWTFVVWGGLHGLYLIIHHLWRRSIDPIWAKRVTSQWYCWISRILTFFAVVMAWIFFRADNMDSALVILQGIFGFNGFSLFSSLIWPSKTIPWLGLLLILVWLMPNTQEIMGRYQKALNVLPNHSGRKKLRWLFWKPQKRWAFVTALVLISCLFTIANTTSSEFLYYQF